ncbi:hypothetical protein [Succinimonas sp.]|uniref:hypothetical protein n=1 Tax=Succinimonas sp. TaxID=1936151 RepID=UPI0038688FFC
MSWFDDICDTVSTGIDTALDLASSACDTAKEAGEWAWDHRKEIGEVIEAAEEVVIENTPKDPLEY